MLSMLIGNKTINQLKAAFLLELETLFPILMKSYMSRLEKDLDLENLVTQKIAGFSISKTEDLVYRSANKQLLKVQLFGAVIGLLVGCIQLFINTQLYSQSFVNTSNLPHFIIPLINLDVLYLGF